MMKFIVRRIGILIPLLILISIVSFVVIQLPPGDYVDSYIRNLELQGGSLNSAQKVSLQRQYGLDQPFIVQYFLWIGKIVLHGDFGNSFKFQRPVADLLLERIPRTIALSLASIFLTWLIAIPIGILSALKKYTIWDYFFTFAQFLGAVDPSVFAGTGAAVYGVYQHRLHDHRPVLARVPRCTLVVRQVHRYAAECLAAAAGPFGNRFRGIDPHPASDPAG